VQTLWRQDPQLSPETSYERLWEEAQLLLRQHQHRDAETTFRKLLELFPDESLRPRSLMGLARVYNARRRHEEQIPLLAVIVSKYPRSPEASHALFRLAMIHWNRNENQTALAHFKRLIDRYPTSSSADTATIALARIYQSLDQSPEAVKLLRAFPRMFPSSSLREEAKWRLAWIYYIRADIKRAYATFKSLAEDTDAKRHQIGAQYWQARSAEQMGNAEEAQRIYLAIARNHDESFYAGAASRRLESLNGESRVAQSHPPSTPLDVSLSERAAFHLARARELAALSLFSLALAELDEIRGEFSDAASKFLLTREYERIGAYHRSVVLASQIHLNSDAVKAQRYPLAYWDIIKPKAEEKGLDPYLVLALIRQESLFDPSAVSPANALGLMQLIPATAARIAKQLGRAEPTREALLDPELNLTLGTTYLRELLTLYANDPVKALAAYNAGERVVARWEKEIPTDDPEEFVERITYRETLQYVKLVLRSHRLYRGLYAGVQ
jgi:soluble lytic murein transglycosylase